MALHRLNPMRFYYLNPLAMQNAIDKHIEQLEFECSLFELLIANKICLMPGSGGVKADKGPVPIIDITR